MQGILPFNEARDYVRKLNLKSIREWQDYCEKRNRPYYVPSIPSVAYKNKGWKGYPDFLGYSYVKPSYLPFQKAKEFVRQLNLKNQAEWQDYCKSGNKPDNIPSNPAYRYRKTGWCGFADFLGYDGKRFLSYEDAKKFIHKLNLKSEDEWEQYSRSASKPGNIPKSPRTVYKDKGWISISDFVGYRGNSDFWPYEKAREFLHLLKLKSEREWKKYCASGNKPNEIPAQPREKYRSKGWKGFPDFLGYEKIYFLPFDEAKNFVQKLNLRSRGEWKKYCNSGNLPKNIPKEPSYVYKNKGWKNYVDFLGVKKVFKYLPFEEAKHFVHKLNLKSQSEWNKYKKSPERPSNIPTDPFSIYRSKGWKGFPDFLGYTYEKKIFLSFEEAKSFVQKLHIKNAKEWIRYCLSGNKLENIPTKPQMTYKNKGWKGFPDFLGYEFIKKPSIPFEQAREFARKLNLKSYEEWNQYCNSGKKPSYIPAKVEGVYKSEGWKGYADFLGYDKRSHLSFEEARDFARGLRFTSSTQWKAYSQSGNKPQNIPGNPAEAYKDSGWQGYPNFLGYKPNRTYL